MVANCLTNEPKFANQKNLYIFLYLSRLKFRKTFWEATGNNRITVQEASLFS